MISLVMGNSVNRWPVASARALAIAARDGARCERPTWSAEKYTHVSDMGS
jgi:hypothetical protein